MDFSLYRSDYIIVSGLKSPLYVESFYRLSTVAEVSALCARTFMAFSALFIYASFMALFKILWDRA
jgi:hypothetical protein